MRYEEIIQEASRLAAGVRRDEIPRQYRSLPFLGAGTTTVAYERDPKTVYLFTRDIMKLEWLRSQDMARVVGEYESHSNPIMGLSDLPIYILEMPKLFPLSKENAKLIRKAVKEFETVLHTHADYFSHSRKAAKADQYRKVLMHFSENENHILGELWSFLMNYGAEQYTFDLGIRNFMQDAENKIVILDPIVCAEMMQIIRDHQTKKSERSFGAYNHW